MFSLLWDFKIFIFPFEGWLPVWLPEWGSPGLRYWHQLQSVNQGWGRKESCSSQWEELQGLLPQKLQTISIHTRCDKCSEHTGGCLPFIMAYCCCPSVTQSCPVLLKPMTAAHQAPLSMGFPRQEYWSGLPFPPPGDLPDPEMGPTSLASLLYCKQIFYRWATGDALIMPYKYTECLFGKAGVWGEG